MITYLSSAASAIVGVIAETATSTVAVSLLLRYTYTHSLPHSHVIQCFVFHILCTTYKHTSITSKRCSPQSDIEAETLSYPWHISPRLTTELWKIR